MRAVWILQGGWISTDDLQAIGKICGAVRGSSEGAALRRGISALSPTDTAGLTGGWILPALLVHGDYFNLLEARVILPAAIAGLLGAYAGVRARARWQYALLAISVALSVAFWALAPSGWWATRPAAMPGSVVAPR